MNFFSKASNFISDSLDDLQVPENLDQIDLDNIGDLNFGDLGLDEVINGIKEALSVAIKSTVDLAGAEGGFLNNEKVKIPVPEEYDSFTDAIRGLGGGQYIDEFEVAVNRAAEASAGQVLDIFVNAINSLTLNHVKTIWKGNSNEATLYLENTCKEPLTQKITPIVSTSMDQCEVATIFDKIQDALNKVDIFNIIPDIDIEQYTVQKTLTGLFTYMSEQEELIRNNPAFRVTELLETVFADNN
eukprot:TRINITY_DN318_c0_g1_i3.p1 TRINITY_DN318_c0_g1~~TRINITY_DN318_c0_g1_i3.p1  ORF type:complete len:243 (-),score=86.22 TRINITY_DN318_c0_g1_i3:886-1614(-)